MNDIIERYIYSFHMPLFFFISGMLYKKNNSRKKFILKKLNGLVLPFVIWDLLSALKAVIIDNTNLLLLLQQAIFVNGKRIWNAPIWFLIVLFFTEYIYDFFSRKNIKSIFLIVISFLLFFLVGKYSNMLFLINLIPMSLLFYTLGNNFMKKLEEKDDCVNKYIEKIFMLCLITISFIFGGIFNCRVTYTGAKFGNIMYFLLASVTGVLFFVMLSRKIGANKILQKLGRYSLFFMCSQYWVIQVLNFILNKILKIKFETNVINNILYSIIFTSISAICIYILVIILKKIEDKIPVIKKINYSIGIR